MICLDEAQYLNNDILKDLKMLCNFSMDSKNCFSVLLLGQPTLTGLLMRQPNEALRQRITVNYQFEGLQEKEALDYIETQMNLVGASGRIFDENAALVAYGSCGGSIVFGSGSTSVCMPVLPTIDIKYFGVSVKIDSALSST